MFFNMNIIDLCNLIKVQVIIKHKLSYMLYLLDVHAKRCVRNFNYPSQFNHKF